MNHDFDCWNSFPLSSVDKVTTGTQRFVTVIASVVSWFGVAFDIKKFAGEVRMRLI